MATVLCPSLVALDPVPCNEPSCAAQHTHTPAFCDPCKAVHAQVHSTIHLASVGHRLRVEGPVAPVRCIVCCPMGHEPLAQFLFVGPEHYAVHARTSAHRAKLSKIKPDASIGMGRPSFDRPYSRGSTSMAPPRSMTSPGPGSRPSSSMSFDGGIANAPGGPAPHPLADTEYALCALCHTVLPVPPVDLAFLHEHGKPSNRIVSHGSDATVIDNRPRRRIKDDEDDTSTVLTTTDPQAETETRKSLVLAHHNAHDAEHARRLRFPRFKEAWERRMKKQATLDGDPEPEDAEHEQEYEQEPEEEHEPPAPKAVLSPGQIAASPSQLSLSSLSASPSVAVMGLDGEDVYETYGRALKAFDKRSEVGVRLPPPPPPPKRDEDNESIVDWESRLTNTESPPQPQFQPRAPSTRSISSASTTYTYDSMGRRYARDETGRAFPVDSEGRILMNGASVPLQIPSHLLPSLSPMTHSTGGDSEPDKLSLDDGFREPGPPPPIPGKSTPSAPSRFRDPGPPPPIARPASRTASPAPGAKPRTSSPAPVKPRTSSPAPVAKPRTSSPMPPPKPAAPAPKFSPSAKPLPFNHPPPRPPSAPIPRRSVSVSSTGQSQPYVPSPSPPPRLAFDTYGRVLKLGMLGWERDTSGALQLGPTVPSESSRTESSRTEYRPAHSVSTSSAPSSSAPVSETSSQPEVEEEEEEEEPEPPRSPTPEPEPEPEPEPRRAPSPIGTEIGVPRGVATVSAPQRYTLIPGRSDASTTSSPPPSTGSHTRSSSSMSMRSGGTSHHHHHHQLPFTGGPSQLGFGGATLSFGTSLEKGLALGLEPVPSHLSGPVGGSISRPTHGRSASASASGTRSASAQPAFREPMRSATVSQPVRASVSPPVRTTVSQPVRTTITPAVRSSTVTPSRSSGTSSGTAYTPRSLLQTTGPTTRVTRPVVARKSTGEWTRIEGKDGDGVSGGWKNRTHTPEVLNEEERENEPMSESEGEGDKSHSEASQLIREFTGKPTEAPKPIEAPRSGTARVISRTSTLPARTRDPVPMPAPARNPSSASLRANESIYGTAARQHSARTFSPSAAWSSLTPASPRSQSDGFSVDEFGSFGTLRY